MSTLFALAVSVTLLATSIPSASAAAWTFEKSAGNTLVFKNESKTEILTTSVQNPNFIALLTDPESGTPYVIYDARSCTNCDMTGSLVYLQRMDGKGKSTTVTFPGKVTDPKKGLVYDGRLFYGHCLPKVKQGIVVHQRELVDRRGIQKSVLIAEPGPQYVYEVLLETRRQPSLSTTLDYVKKKTCFEVAGKVRAVHGKNTQFGSKPVKADDDEEDELPKEKVDPKGDPTTDEAPKSP